MQSLSSVQQATTTLDQSSHGPGLRPPQLPGATGLSGHLHELSRDNLALFRRCAEVGGIARFRVYWYCCHVVTDPALAGALLTTHASSFKKTRALQVARPTFGNGLVTAEGEVWRAQQRRLRAFFTPRAAEGYSALIAEATQNKLQSWRPAAVVDLRDDMIDISLEVVCRALFGLEAGRLKPLIREAAEAVQDWHSACQALCLPYPHYLPTLDNFRYRRRNRALDRAVLQIIREVRASGGADNGLLGSLVRFRDQDGSAIGDQEIRDQVVTLFLAGHDTTAAALAFALYELSYRPDLQARIALQTRAGGEDECLEQVLKETLRLYPPVHLVARTALCDVRLGDYLVRQGEEVVLPLSVMQRRAELFQSPDDFLPERWADGSLQGNHRHAHLPFSTGPRVCIGQHLAMAELRSIVAGVLAHHRLEPLAPRNPRFDNRMTLAPAPGSAQVRVVSVKVGSHGRARPVPDMSQGGP